MGRIHNRPLSLLPVECLTPTDYTADRSCQKLHKNLYQKRHRKKHKGAFDYYISTFGGRGLTRNAYFGYVFGVGECQRQKYLCKRSLATAIEFLREAAELADNYPELTNEIYQSSTYELIMELFPIDYSEKFNDIVGDKNANEKKKIENLILQYMIYI